MLPASDDHTTLRSHSLRLSVGQRFTVIVVTEQIYAGGYKSLVHSRTNVSSNFNFPHNFNDDAAREN